MKKDLILYFTTDNKSGKKSSEKWLSKNNKELYEDIIVWSNKHEHLKNIFFVRKIFHYIYETTEIPVCSTCKKEVVFRFLKIGYQKHCSDKCVKDSADYKIKWQESWLKNNSNKEFIKKRNKTVIEKYGSIEKYKEIVSNNKKINVKNKYGVEFVTQTKEFKDKSKKTKLEKYGDEFWNNKDKTREIRIKNGTQIDDTLALSFKNYKKIATNRSNIIYRNNKTAINPNNLKIGINKYNLDHRFSLKQGFLKNIPIEIISHPSNLQVIWHMDNKKKQDKCDITLNELLFEVINYKKKIIIRHSKLNKLYLKQNLKKCLNYSKKIFYIKNKP